MPDPEMDKLEAETMKLTAEAMNKATMNVDLEDEEAVGDNFSKLGDIKLKEKEDGKESAGNEAGVGTISGSPRTPTTESGFREADQSIDGDGTSS